MHPSFTRVALLLLSGITFIDATASTALAQGQGFQVERYEPAPPGEWTFMVDHPWYSSTRRFAMGFDLDYTHKPLVFGHSDDKGQLSQDGTVIGHQLVGHVSAAVAVWDRLQFSLSIPFTLLERGQTVFGASPIEGGALGDPRLGVTVRLWHQSDRDAFSLHLAGLLWIPVGDQAQHAGDKDARFLPKLIAAGLLRDHWRWSASVGFLFRSAQAIGSAGSGAGNGVGKELQLAAALGYTNTARTWSLGPELLLGTIVSEGDSFGKASSSLELLLGGRYEVWRSMVAGAGIGLGFLGLPGTPDVRAVFSLAYAPAGDRDHDGIADGDDACPDVPGHHNADRSLNGCPPDRDGDGVGDCEDRCPDVAMGPSPDPKRLGCPLSDRDGDGVADDLDLCPDVPMGATPDPKRLGCPLADRDHDGVTDDKDLCPDQSNQPNPDPNRLGCPIRDRDGDGITDEKDLCPDLAAGPHPDKTRLGCPDKDTDGDGIYDHDDLCPEVPAGISPDPARRGCPAPDRDKDGVPDVVDACPDEPGAPDPDPKKNGCPGLVLVKAGRIAILQPVLFIPYTDTIDTQSAPVLEAVGKALVATPEIKKVEVAGHTDYIGKPEDNQALSDRRSEAVRKYLIDHGTAPERLVAKGYGSQFPISHAKSFKERQVNRRVEFVIIDPPQPPLPEPAVAPKAPARGKGGRRRGR